MNVQALTLDLSKRSDVTQVVRIRQSDVNGTHIYATITDNDEAADLTGATANLRIKKPRNGGYYKKNGPISGNVARFTINETGASFESGITDVAYVEITKDGAVTSTERFRVVIEKSARV